MLPLLWEAIGLLEIECNLWVVAVTSDGASANRALFEMHKNLDKTPAAADNFCNKTINLFAPLEICLLFRRCTAFTENC